MAIEWGGVKPTRKKIKYKRKKRGLVLAGVGCTSVVQKERECVKTRCAAIAAHTKALLNGTRAER
jgi:hypothetical protein